MSGRIKYTDELLGNLRVVPDFLPRPEELVFRVEEAKDKCELNHGWKSS
jgi:hypothetical protein